MDNRGICAALMAIGALLLVLKLSPRVTRAAWIALLVAGIVNAVVLSRLPNNLVNINLVHHFLGAKYSFSYDSFYRLINAARETPQVDMRDLERPPAMIRSDPRSQRAYYIDLMRESGVDFDPLSALPVLHDRATETGCIQREADAILRAHLPAVQVDGFRRDARLALDALSGRDITTDYGFNGSPFYSLIRHVDPTLHRPFGSATAWLNMMWQIAAVLLLAWIAGAALRVDVTARFAMAALLFASWDFVGWALPGLVFAGLWLPVALAILAFRRRAAVGAGVAIAWAGLIKIFPFVLLLPAGVRMVRGVVRRERNAVAQSAAVITVCIVAAGVLGAAGMLSGHSWGDFLHKIVVQFQSKAYLLNSVSLSQGLFTIGIHGSPLPAILALVALAMFALLCVRGGEDDFADALPRRSLVLLSATGLWAHTWFNYYAIIPLFLLPVVAQRHAVGAAVAAAATAVAFVLPEFDSPTLLNHKILFTLKVAPYIAIPIWLIALEMRDAGLSRRVQRVVAVIVVLCCVVTVAEWARMRSINSLDRIGGAHLDNGRSLEALEQYQKLVKLAPRNAMAHMNRGIALTMLKSEAQAGDAFARAVALGPSSEYARLNYGRWLLKMGRISEAAAELETAKELAPYDDGILLYLAQALMGLERIDDARAVLIRARELNPGNRRTRAMLAELER